MCVVGHGIDIVSVAQVRRRLDTAGEDFLASFTDSERASAGPQSRWPEYYAGRFAAKEAVAKALGTGFNFGETYG